MNQINLSNNLVLSFEPLDKRVRLVVFSEGKELACRKETIKKLELFLATDETHLFKGRLQLNKKKDLINIVLKNQSVGVISSTELSKALQ
jgi:hypothetical protein